MKSRNKYRSLRKRVLPDTVSSGLRLLAAIVLIVLLLWLIDLQSAWAHLQMTDWRWIAVALLVVQVQVILSALRWKITAARLGQRIALARAVSEYYLATLANLSLPGGVLGDAARIVRNQQAHSLGIAAHGVLLERLAGQLALLLVSIIGWILWPVLMHGSMPELGMRVLLVTLAMIVLLSLIVFLVVKLAPDWITQTIVNVGPSVHAAWIADRQWLLQGCLSISIVLSYLAVFWLASYALSVPLSPGAIITIVPLVLLSMIIPLSIGGWGVREASAAIMWPLAGMSSEAGVATSVVYALVSSIGCLPGLLSLLSRSR